MYSIYQYDNPKTEEIIYIGLTNNLQRRSLEHMRDKNSPVYIAAMEMREHGIELRQSVLDLAETLTEAMSVEKALIQEKKPRRNRIHNAAGIEKSREDEFYASTVLNAMKEWGLSYKQAILYAQHFPISGGNIADFELVWKTANITRRTLGYTTDFSPAEILNIAFKIYKVEPSGDLNMSQEQLYDAVQAAQEGDMIEYSRRPQYYIARGTYISYHPTSKNYIIVNDFRSGSDVAVMIKDVLNVQREAVEA